MYAIKCIFQGTTGIPGMNNNWDKITTRMKTYQGISRATLGEIGNRVSAMTVSTAKDEAEIVFPQPACEIVTRARAAKTKVMPTVSYENGRQVAAAKAQAKNAKNKVVSIYCIPV